MREAERRLRRDFLQAASVAGLLLAGMLVDLRPAWFGIPLDSRGHGAPGYLRPLWALEGLLSLLILLGPARSLFSSAWRQLARRRAHMDTLIALGTGVAWLYSALVVIAPGAFPPGAAAPLFDASAMVAALALMGHWLEARARSRTGEVLEALSRLGVRSVRVRRADGDQQLPPEAVRVSDLVVVRPGERLAADGVVFDGASHVDESMLTGESDPVWKGPGDLVYGGTLNEEGALAFRATRVGAGMTLRRLVEAVRRAQASRPPSVRLVEGVSRLFLPLLATLSVLTFAAWYRFGGELGLLHGLVMAASVLLISGPCALGLTTPLSLGVGLGRMAEAGILVRSGEALEAAASLDLVCLDRAGSLTEGRPAVTDVVPAPGVAGVDLLRVAAAAEAGAQHPLAAAVVEAARERGVPVGRASSFEALPGRGVRASLNGVLVRVGRRELALNGAAVDGGLEATARRLAEAGRTLVWVSRDGTALGLLAVADRLRPEAAQAVARLRGLGLRVVLLTGDAPTTAWAVAREAGIDEVRAGLQPEHKREAIRQLQAEGRRVGMLGDAVSDAPALARADVGFAIAGGAELNLASADITLLGGGLAALPAAILASRRTLANIRQNLVSVFAYGVVAVVVATGALVPWLGAGALLSPLLAGSALSLSSITAVSNALRLRRAEVRP
jgi:Cu+-exporting ATPase